jgi:hypothetical protein
MDFLQEISDFIVQGLYTHLFCSKYTSFDLPMGSREFQGQDMQFHMKVQQYKDVATPEDFGIPEEILNPLHEQMWSKAIRELKRMDSMVTTGSKLRCLLNSFIIVNNAFSLFGGTKEGMAASADDLLGIFPYIVLKSEMYNLI